METITLHVAMVGDKPKGLFTDKIPTKKYWDELRTVEVPKADYESEKITISNIKTYLK